MPFKIFTIIATATSIAAPGRLVVTMDQHRIGAIGLTVLVLALGAAVAIARKRW
jgi:hypothetical protein